MKSQTIKSEPAVEKINLHTFIILKKLSVSIEHRMQRRTNNDTSEKTMAEWESIYTQTMTRETK